MNRSLQDAHVHRVARTSTKLLRDPTMVNQNVPDEQHLFEQAPPGEGRVVAPTSFVFLAPCSSRVPGSYWAQLLTQRNQQRVVGSPP